MWHARECFSYTLHSHVKLKLDFLNQCVTCVLAAGGALYCSVVDQKDFRRGPCAEAAGGRSINGLPGL